MVEGRERCTTHWGFRNCLFRSGQKKQAFDTKVSRIFSTESSIIPKINSPKADSLDFHRSKFHWNRIIEQLKLLCWGRYGKCKISWRTFVINSTIWIAGKWIARYSLGNLRFSIFSYAATSSKAIGETLERCDQCYRRMIPHTQLQAIRFVMKFIDSIAKVARRNSSVMLRRKCGCEKVYTKSSTNSSVSARLWIDNVT